MSTKKTGHTPKKVATKKIPGSKNGPIKGANKASPVQPRGTTKSAAAKAASKKPIRVLTGGPRRGSKA
jgi:hypothetical protein